MTWFYVISFGDSKIGYLLLLKKNNKLLTNVTSFANIVLMDKIKVFVKRKLGILMIMNPIANMIVLIKFRFLS